MSQKRHLIWLMLIVIITLFLVTVFIYYYLNQKDINLIPHFLSPNLSSSSNMTEAANAAAVRSWDPSNGALIYADRDGVFKIYINKMDYLVIVPVYTDNKPNTEEIVNSIDSLYWKNAFCLDDMITFENTDQKPIIIRNNGSRLCVN
jgi:hypothetical protein